MIGCTVENLLIKGPASKQIGGLIGVCLKQGDKMPMFIVNSTARNVSLFGLDDQPLDYTDVGDLQRTVISTDAEGVSIAFWPAQNFGFTAGIFTLYGDATSDQLSAQVADGYAAVDNGDGTYTVQPTFTLAVTQSENGTLTTDPAAGQILAGTTVRVTATPAEGFKLKEVTFNGAVVAEWESFTMPSEAVTIAAVFEEDAKPVVDPTKPTEVKAESAEKACEKIEVKAPDAAGELTAEQLAAYQGYFVKSAKETATPGVWEVSVALSAEGEAQLIKDAKITAEAGGASVTLTPAKVVPGFFYGVAQNTALESVKTSAPAKWTVATTTGLADGALTVEKTPTATQEFFVIKVSPTGN